MLRFGNYEDLELKRVRVDGPAGQGNLNTYVRLDQPF